MPAPRPTYFYVTLSLALVLFLLGLVGWWTLQANRLTQRLQEELDIIVELEAEHAPAQRTALLTYLAEAPFRRPGSEPTYVPKAEALDALGEDLSGDLADLGLTNPLLDVVTFNVPVAYLRSDSLAAVAIAVQAQPGVASVHYQENFLERVATNARRLSYALLGLAALFAFVAGLLIYNTVRLSLYADRLLIRTQQLVGATRGFISRPYLRRSLGQGLLAGLLAAAGVFGLQYWLGRVLPELELYADPPGLALLYGGILLLGLSINFLSHLVVVRRYLRLRPDDFQ